MTINYALDLVHDNPWNERPLDRENVANVADLGRQEIHLLDLTRMTREERARLVAHICSRFGARAAEVDHQLDTQGLPLLAADLVVAIPLRLLI